METRHKNYIVKEVNIIDKCLYQIVLFMAKKFQASLKRFKQIRPPLGSFQFFFVSIKFKMIRLKWIKLLISFCLLETKLWSNFF